MRRIEIFLLHIVSLVAFGNLYYLSGFIGVSNNIILVLCLFISFLYSFRHYNKFKSTFYNKIFRLFLFLSLVLIPVNIFSGYSFQVNHIVRILWYVLLFNWIMNLYKDQWQIQKYLKRIGFILFACFILLSYIEYYSPELFKIVVYGELPEEANEVSRIAITYRDSNTFTSITCLFLYLLLRLDEKHNILLNLFLVIVSAVLVNLSGSRMGGLLLVIIFTWWSYKNFSLKMFLTIVIGSIISLSFYLNSAKDNSDNESASLITRVFNTDSKQHMMAKASSDERESSIYSAIEYGFSSNLLFPAGNFYFDNKWRNTDNHDYHFPHSSFVYLFCEYGIYCIFIFILFFRLFLLARRNKELLLFILTTIPLSLLPNIVYIFPIYLCAFIIEFKILSLYENKNILCDKSTI